MACGGCGARAARLHRKLGFVKKGTALELHRRSGFVFLLEDSVRRYHIRLTLLSLFAWLLLPRSR